MNDWKRWIERYVHAVARHLPSGQRADVAEELRSLLIEQVEERQQGSHESAEEAALTAIAEFGEPAVVARHYAPGRPVLVSPRLYRPMKIALAVVLGVWSVSTALWLFDVITTTTYVFPFRFEFTEDTSPGDLIYGLLSNLGIVLLVFVVIDRLMGEGGEDPSERAWDPHALPDLSAREPVSRFESAFGVVIPLYVLYALHVTPDWFGFTVSIDGGREYWQLFHPNYRSFLPWIDAWLIPSLALDGWLLWRGERGLVVRWLQIGFEAFGALVLFRIAAGGPFTVIDQALDPVLVIMGIVCAVVAVFGAVKALRVMRTGRLLPRANGAGANGV